MAISSATFRTLLELWPEEIGKSAFYWSKSGVRPVTPRSILRIMPIRTLRAHGLQTITCLGAQDTHRAQLTSTTSAPRCAGIQLLKILKNGIQLFFRNTTTSISDSYSNPLRRNVTVESDRSVMSELYRVSNNVLLIVLAMTIP